MPSTRAPAADSPGLPVTAKRLIGAIAIGAVGGAVFKLINMPLAWMLGAMIATTVAALSGVPVAMTNRVRGPMVSVLGVLLGSAFTPDILGRAAHWASGLIILAAFVIIATGLSYTYFRLVAKTNTVTAYFAAAPGGLNVMFLYGEAMGGDDRVIAISHACRILFVVLTVPFFFRWVEGVSSSYAAAAAGPAGNLLDFPLDDAAILIACAIAGYWGGKLLKLQAAQLVGPLVLSAIVHMSGITASRPPAELVAIAQVFMGAGIGCRFTGMRILSVGRIMLHALASTVLMLSVTTTMALSLGSPDGISSAALALALSPGGVAEMSLIGLALGVDVAFVSTMHIVRITFVIMIAGPLFRLLRKHD